MNRSADWLHQAHAGLELAEGVEKDLKGLHLRHALSIVDTIAAALALGGAAPELPLSCDVLVLTPQDSACQAAP
jgi:hypothetical protein